MTPLDVLFTSSAVLCISVQNHGFFSKKQECYCGRTARARAGVRWQRLGWRLGWSWRMNFSNLLMVKIEALRKSWRRSLIQTIERLGESGATHDSQSASRSGVEAWVGRLRCRTQPGLSPVPERTGKLAPLTPFYSIIVPVVQFFGRSSFLLWQSWLVRLRLT